MLFGWVPDHSSLDVTQSLCHIAAALRIQASQQVEMWSEPGLGVGLFRMPPLDRGEATSAEPATDPTGRFTLWMAGEAFTWAGTSLMNAGESETPAFRLRLLTCILEGGVRVLKDLDGEYQIALWDRLERRLTLAVDRFGALPLYWSKGTQGFGFAGGVRGVLMVPGVELSPDTTALQQAVTFGGFRLGNRTNIARVHQAPPAGAIVYDRAASRIDRYWSWQEAPTPVEGSDADRLRTTQETWREAIRLRLQGSGRPGLTLSGGLDSRAILAEAALQSPQIAAVTYGVPQSDDVRFARRAARAAGADWRAFPLYADGWLDRRVAHVLATDGMVNLVDLMHMEVLPQLPLVMDLYLSGYIGDLVSGGTYLDIRSVEEVLASMPYYGGRLGLSLDEAAALAENALTSVGGRGHFISYEHKLPQSTNRITAAARAWVRVRRPFVAYEFWNQAYTVPLALRRQHLWHEGWLRTTYPQLFARIPNQRTAVPPGASRARHQMMRVARYGWRNLLRTAARVGLPVVPPERTYHPDWQAWRTPAVRALITTTILGRDSIAQEVFGRHRLEATLADFFEQDAAPTQVIGALFSYECYHRQLPAALTAARLAPEGRGRVRRTVLPAASGDRVSP